MLGELTPAQIEHILHAQFVGRLGCYADGKMYIVPLTFVYHDGYLYAHSKEGMKVKMMRKNPQVCFQVDDMDNMTNWRSVVIWGKYEELKTEKEQQSGMKILVDGLTPFMTSETVKPHNFQDGPEVVEKGLKAVAYRIKIMEKTGRYEKT